MDPRWSTEAGQRRAMQIGLRFYTVIDAAELLRLSPATLYWEIRAGRFPAIRIRGRQPRMSPNTPRSATATGVAR
jgi:excisionase family DNA binding protein